ncbi:MAG: Hsp33 family molecular chaperone HslO [Acholeplasmataceae bacterium]
MDHVLIATAYNNEARIYVANTKDLVEEARVIHQTQPTASAALGRLLTVGGMMSPMYKDNSFIALKVEGDGPIGNMIVESSQTGELRAVIKNPDVYITYNDSGKLAVGKAVGNGILTVRRDPHMKHAFASSVELQTGEIGDDFTYYFTLSEQTPSSVGVGVSVNEHITYAGGFIIQLLPGASEETITTIENILSKLTGVTDLFEQGLNTYQILELLSNNTHNLLGSKPLSYHCGCTKAYYSDSLMKLDNELLDQLIHEDHGAEIVCQYCHTKYNFTEADLRLIQIKKQD